ncbi:hypothetical protein [Heyndrickxia sporothermodurans]
MIDLGRLFDRICADNSSDLQGSEPSFPETFPEISGRFPARKNLYVIDNDEFSGVSGISGSEKGGMGSGNTFHDHRKDWEAGAAGHARGVYVPEPEKPEIPEKPSKHPQDQVLSISGSSSFLPEKRRENRKNQPLRADSEPSEPAERLAEWRAGLARLDPDYAPCAGYRHGDWPRILANAVAFLDDHGLWAAKLGWSTAELFGVHEEAGAVRMDACGALAIGPTPVRWLTSSAITHANGNTYRRKPGQPIGTPWWNLTNLPF